MTAEEILNMPVPEGALFNRINLRKLQIIYANVRMPTEQTSTDARRGCSSWSRLACLS